MHFVWYELLTESIEQSWTNHIPNKSKIRWIDTKCWMTIDRHATSKEYTERKYTGFLFRLFFWTVRWVQFVCLFFGWMWLFVIFDMHFTGISYGSTHTFSTFHLLNSICSCLVFHILSIWSFLLCSLCVHLDAVETFESTLCVRRALTFTFYDKLILILSQDQTNSNQSYVTY